MRYIFVKTSLSFDALAQKLREILNIPAINQSPWQIDQERESINHGGKYYLLETFGLELELLQNAGEVEIQEHADAPFYMLLNSHYQIDLASIERLTEHLYQVLKQAGLEVTI